jgi:hypothetical protein
MQWLAACAVALLLALPLAGCETSPELRRPQSYSKDGISFRYPSNWSVSEDVETPGASGYRYLFIDSPGSATVIVQHYQPGTALSVEEFAGNFHRKLIETVGDVARVGPLKPFSGQAGNAVPVRAVVAGVPRGGIEYSFSISGAGQQVPHKFRAFKVESASATTFLVAQAATEDWDLVAPGFDLVLGSFEVE